MFEEHKFYNCVVTMDDGTQLKIDANSLHNHSLDLFEDWKCWVGVNRIYIDSNKNVYSGQCLNDYLGNLMTNWDIMDNYSVCKQKQCSGCTDDLIVKKQK
jgi:hypothetical protein